MRQEHQLPIQRGCRCVDLSRAAYYRAPRPADERDREVIDALNVLVEKYPRRGLDKLYPMLRQQGHPWNRKRVHRVYRQMGLNHKRRTKKRLPRRERQELFVPQSPNEVWSADFMADALYCGRRFRTFNVIDDHNREAVDIEIDTSITGLRLIRVFERLKVERGLPDVLRVDNGPEFLADSFTEWAEDNGMMIRYIQPGEPNQNAYIERFNRTYREEVLNLYLFRDLDEVREITHWWLIDYNEQRPHESLGDLPPIEYVSRNAVGSKNSLST